MPQNTTDRCSNNKSMKTSPFSVLPNVICLYYCLIIRPRKFQTTINRNIMIVTVRMCTHISETKSFILNLMIPDHGDHDMLHFLLLSIYLNGTSLLTDA